MTKSGYQNSTSRGCTTLGFTLMNKSKLSFIHLLYGSVWKKLFFKKFIKIYLQTTSLKGVQPSGLLYFASQQSFTCTKLGLRLYTTCTSRNHYYHYFIFHKISSIILFKNYSLAMKTKHFQSVYNPGVGFKIFEMINLDEQN